jgi:hypothetical protein
LSAMEVNCSGSFGPKVVTSAKAGHVTRSVSLSSGAVLMQYEVMDSSGGAYSAAAFIPFVDPSGHPADYLDG